MRIGFGLGATLNMLLRLSGATGERREGERRHKSFCIRSHTNIYSATVLNQLAGHFRCFIGCDASANTYEYMHNRYPIEGGYTSMISVSFEDNMSSIRAITPLVVF